MDNKIVKYAEWVESYEGNNNRIHYRNIRRKILDEKNGLLLVEDPREGKVWINKGGVKFIRHEIDKA